MALAAAAWLTHQSTCRNRNSGRSSRRRERRKTTVWHSRGVKIGQQRRRREGKGSKFGGKAPESLTYLSTLAYWLWSLQESGRRFGSCKKCEDSLATTTTTTLMMMPKGACEQWIGQTQTNLASLSLTQCTAPHRAKALIKVSPRCRPSQLRASEQSSNRVVQPCQGKVSAEEVLQQHQNRHFCPPTHNTSLTYMHPKVLGFVQEMYTNLEEVG